jgi:hypothetical protein
LKLSQIRNLSWTVALCSAGICGFYTYKTATTKITVPKIREWVPSEPELDDFDQAKRMSEQRLMNALAFLTKIDVPPPIVINKTPTVTKTPVKVPVAPVPTILNLPIQLTFIAYNEESQRHVAFIKAERFFGHPYFEGEKIMDLEQDVHVAKITQTYVIVKDKRGLEQKLELKKTAIKSFYTLPAKTIRSEIFKPAVHKPVAAPTAKPSQKNKFRIVPRTRNKALDEKYGINIVEYNKGEEDKRYAISDADKNKLETRKLELLSEINANPAYDNSGNPVGIKIDFMVDDPLLKKYNFNNGDIVTHINDKQVKSVADGQNLYDKLTPTDRRVKIEKLDKNNRKMIIYLEMDDFPNVPQR